MRRIQGLCCLLLLGVTGCGDFFVPQTNSGGGTNTGDYLYVAQWKQYFPCRIWGQQQRSPFGSHQLALQQRGCRGNRLP